MGTIYVIATKRIGKLINYWTLSERILSKINILRLRICVMINFARFNSLVEIALYFDTPKKCMEAIALSRCADGDVVSVHIVADTTATTAATAGIFAASVTRAFPT